MLELLQICGRTLKREELRNGKTRGDAAASWPALLDDESLSGIVEAEREVIKTMETLGMLPLFTSSNILRANENGDIGCIPFSQSFFGFRQSGLIGFCC